jgi:hypothetical protein
MSRQAGKIIRKNLNDASREGRVDLIKRFNKIRRKSNDAFTKELVAEFLLLLNKKFLQRSWVGKRSLADLGFSSLTSLGMDKDLQFAGYWIGREVNRINEFIGHAQQVQDMVLSANWAQANSKVDEFTVTHGWSFWALELKFMFAMKRGGVEEVKTLLAMVRSSSERRVVGLIAKVISERVDDKYSLDSFFSRWRNGISKSTKSKNTIEYVIYRAMGQIDNVEDGLARCLCVDVASSIYDCYETLIDACGILIIEKKIDRMPAIIKCVNELIGRGVKDYRLEKLLVMAGDVTPNKLVADDVVTETDRFLARLVKKRVDLHIPFLENDQLDGADDLIQVKRAQLMRLGINLKSLPIGPALYEYAVQAGRNDVEQNEYLPWACLVGPKLFPEQLLSPDYSHSWDVLEQLTIKNPVCYNAFAGLLQVRQGELTEVILDKMPPVLIAWLCKYLIYIGRFVESQLAIKYLGGKSKYWENTSRRLLLVSKARSGSTSEALTIAQDEVVYHVETLYQYPLREIFVNATYRDFKPFDSISVALVSHHGAQNAAAKEKEKIEHVCRMACKKIHDSGGRTFLSAQWDGLSNVERAKRVHFLTYVWTEDNLSLVGYETSQQLRAERIETMHLLVLINPEKEQEYAAIIRQLTLSNTLWEGITHVDGSRIFVNEPAISRWATGELMQDFMKWQELRELRLSGNVDEEVSYAGAALVEGETLLVNFDISLTDENKLLISIVERLEAKFLMDTLDGLECYLSARIRHGTLRGAILGPMEGAGLLVSGTDRHEFEDFDISDSQRSVLDELCVTLKALVDLALKDKVRLASKSHPEGLLNTDRADSYFPNSVNKMAGASVEFSVFISFCFDSFWQLLKPTRIATRDYFAKQFKTEIRKAFDQALAKLCIIKTDDPLNQALIRLSVETCNQCDSVGKWFYNDGQINNRSFTVNEAIIITEKAAKITYRNFNAEVVIQSSSSLQIPLTGIGLSAIVEGLHVTLENAWKHSGFGHSLYKITIAAKFDSENEVLEFIVKSPVTDERRAILAAGQLVEVQQRTQGSLSITSVAETGGSGLPKLARMSARVDHLVYPKPFLISLDDGFQVLACIPLHRRGEAYDAYYQ